MFYILLLYFLTVLGITIYNFFTIRRIDEVKPSKDDLEANRKVSIIIPMKNVANKVNDLLDSVFENESFLSEVIVVNDESTDGTVEKLFAYKQKHQHKNIIITKGLKKPKDWVGNNFALWEGLEIAQGEILILLSPDVRISSDTTRKIVELLKSSDAITVFPHQKGDLFTTQISNAYLSWWPLSNIPIKYLQNRGSSIGAVSYGGFIAIKRKTYDKVKSYEKSKSTVSGEVILFRDLIKNGYSVETLYSTREISVESYENWKEAVKGYSESFIPINYNSMSLVFFWLIIIGINLLPFIFLPVSYLFLLLIVEISFIKFFISKINGEITIFSIILHPFQMIAMILIIFISIREPLQTTDDLKK